MFPEIVSDAPPGEALDAAVTFTVTVVGVPGTGVTDPEGENVQLNPAGPLHERSTSALKLPADPTWIVNGELPPGVMLSVPGLGALKVKSETSTVTGA